VSSALFTIEVRALRLASTGRGTNMRIDRYHTVRWGRWLATFVGFPLAGVAARLAVGEIDSTAAAVVGGVVGGTVLGAAQAVIGGIDRASWLRWIVATAAGLGIGLGAGATLAGLATDPASLVLMGAVSGLAVGIAQAASVPMRRVDRALWAVATPALWALGWLITSQVIVDADSRHAIFGSSGAIVVSALSGVLHAARRHEAATSPRLTPAAIDAVVAR
jgi:hypothetical protein